MVSKIRKFKIRKSNPKEREVIIGNKKEKKENQIIEILE